MFYSHVAGKYEFMYESLKSSVRHQYLNSAFLQFKVIKDALRDFQYRVHAIRLQFESIINREIVSRVSGMQNIYFFFFLFFIFNFFLIFYFFLFVFLFFYFIFFIIIFFYFLFLLLLFFYIIIILSVFK